LVPEVGGNHRAELQRRAANGFVRDIYAALREHLLDIQQAEGKAEMESDGVLDYLTREAVPFVRIRAILVTPKPGKRAMVETIPR
jgi:hypothetical protein